MTQIYPNKILFTGAGFSMDFGGYSAAQMAEEMFNVIEGEVPAVREALIEYINDYESLATKIHLDNNGYPEDFKDIFYKALNDAYRVLNESIKAKLRDNLKEEQRHNDPSKNPNRKLISFVNSFDAVFTLNQDILLEYSNIANSKEFKIIGTQIDHGDTRKPDFEPNSRIKNLNVDTTLIVDTYSPKSYYKLHGSSEWIENGKPIPLIVGTQKPELINKIPLFKSMLNIFEQVMKEDNIEVTIIGYAGKDPHINSILKTCRHLEIIDPNADELLEKFKNGNNIQGIHSKTLNAYLSNK